MSAGGSTVRRRDQAEREKKNEHAEFKKLISLDDRHKMKKN